MNCQTPYHVIDLDVLHQNLDNQIHTLMDKANCKMLLAIKGFSSDIVLPLIRDKIDGISASGYYEARLGRTYVGKTVFTYSPAYDDLSFERVVDNSDIISFNSVSQYKKYASFAQRKGRSCGLRINPEYSALSQDNGANPCQRFSRLGTKVEDMPPIKEFALGKIEGIHMHTMCDQDADELEKTIDILINQFDEYLCRIRWINLGGGQMYAREGYDIENAIKSIQRLHEKYDAEIYLEPCSGIMVNTGSYVVSVVDIVHNEVDIAIVDGSAICHMPDAVYRGWWHDIRGAGEANDFPYQYRIAGCTCYAGDYWGDYSFQNPLSVGDQIVFDDTAYYMMVKSCFFNGIPFPSFATFTKAEGLVVRKKYGFDTFIQNQ